MWRCTRPTGNCRPAFAEREVAFFLEPPRPPLTILNLRSGLWRLPAKKMRGGGLQRWQLRAPRPRRPPPTAPQHALSVAAAAIVGASMVCIAITMHTMNNARRAPRAHASLQPRRHRERPRVRSPREEGQERRARESIVVIERTAVAWERRARARGAPIGSRVQGQGQQRFLGVLRLGSHRLSSRVCCALTIMNRASSLPH